LLEGSTVLSDVHGFIRRAVRRVSRELACQLRGYPSSTFGPHNHPLLHREITHEPRQAIRVHGGPRDIEQHFGCRQRPTACRASVDARRLQESVREVGYWLRVGLCVDVAQQGMVPVRGARCPGLFYSAPLRKVTHVLRTSVVCTCCEFPHVPQAGAVCRLSTYSYARSRGRGPPGHAGGSR